MADHLQTVERLRKMAEKDIDTMSPEDLRKTLKAVKTHLDSEGGSGDIKDVDVRHMLDRIREKVESMRARAEHIKALAVMGEIPTAVPAKDGVEDEEWKRVMIVAELLALDMRENSGGTVGEDGAATPKRKVKMVKKALKSSNPADQ